MLKYFKSAPIGLLFIYAMMCYGYYGVHVVFRMLNCVAGGKMVVGIVIALGLMGLHVGVGYVMRRLDRHA